MYVHFVKDKTGPVKNQFNRKSKHLSMPIELIFFVTNKMAKDKEKVGKRKKIYSYDTNGHVKI